MLNTWQALPLHLNPIAFNLGNLSIRWYSLCYILAFVTIYLLAKYRLRKNTSLNLTLNNLENIILVSFLGALLGGKIGYIIFYDWINFTINPLNTIWPFKDGVFIGIYGMSFHGGLLGALIAGWLYCKKYTLDFWKITNFLIPIFPLGYFWGRIGNFMNSELYGRPTDSPLGMHFTQSDRLTNTLKHPSQLYEAFGEGVLLFFILNYFYKKSTPPNALFLFLIFYGIIRFILEFFRQPDNHLGFILFNWMTLGQILCITMAIAGISALLYQRYISKK